MLDERDKERVLQATNLVDLISKSTPLKKTKGANAWFCCTFHKEKTPSFAVNIARQTYHCFGCGAHGDVIALVANILGISHFRAITMLSIC